MKTVFSRDGQRRDVSPEEAATAWRSGEAGLSPGQHLVRDRQGKLVNLQGRQLSTALLSGGRFATQQETEGEALRQEWDTTTGAMVTAGAEAGNAATFGALDAIGAQVSEGWAENRRAQREANPDAALAGQVVGELGVVLATGGAGGAVRAGARGLSKALASSALKGGAKHAATFAAMEAGATGAGSMAAKMALEAAAGAAEATLFEVGQSISALSIQEAEVTTEHIMAKAGNVLTASVVGGVAGGTLSLIASGAKAGTRAVLKGKTGRKFLSDRMETKGIQAAEAGELSEQAADIARAPRQNRMDSGVDAVVGGTTLRRSQARELAEATDDLAKMESGLNTVAAPETVKAQRRGIKADLDGQFNETLVRQEMGSIVRGLKREWNPTPAMKKQLKTGIKRIDDQGKAFAKERTRETKFVEKARRAEATAETRATAAADKARKKAAEIDAQLTSLQDDFRARDTPDLTPEQFDKIATKARADIKRLEQRRAVLREAPPTPRAPEPFVPDPNVLDFESLQKQLEVRQELQKQLDFSDLAGAPFSEIEKAQIGRFGAEVDNIAREFEVLDAKAGEWTVDEAAKAYQRMEKFKRNLNPFVSQNSRYGAGVQGRARELYGKLKTHLTDDSLWGPQRATKAIDNNKLITEYFDNRGGLRSLQGGKGKRIEGLMGGELDAAATEQGVDEFSMQLLSDSAKVETFSKRIGKLENETAENAMRDHVQALEANNLASRGRGSISDAAFQKNQASLIRWRNAWAKNLERVVDGDAYARSWSVYDIGIRDADHLHSSARVSGHEVMGGIVNPLGAGLAIAASATPKATAHLLKATRGMKTLDIARQSASREIDLAVKALVAGKKTAQQRAARATSSELETFEANVGLVNDWQSDPEAATQRAINRMGPMASATPQNAARFSNNILRQMDALVAKMPILPKGSTYMMDQEPDLRRVSRSEQRKFNSFARGLGDPIGVLQQMQQLQATQEEVMGLSLGYPGIYQEAVRKVQDGLLELDEPISFAQEARISALFGFPLNQALQPARIAAIQQIARGAEGAAQEDDNAISPSRATPPDMAESFATRTEQIKGSVRG